MSLAGLPEGERSGRSRRLSEKQLQRVNARKKTSGRHSCRTTSTERISSAPGRPARLAPAFALRSVSDFDSNRRGRRAGRAKGQSAAEDTCPGPAQRSRMRTYGGLLVNGDSCGSAEAW